MKVLGRILVYAVFACVSGALVWRFALALHTEPARERARACNSLSPNPRFTPRPAPAFTLPNHAGRPVSLASLRGKVVFLNFWATWCPPCRQEMPSMDALAREYAGRDFAMLAVSVDEGWPEVRRFFPKGTTMAVLLDAERRVPGLYGTEKFPETFLIDRKGVIRHHIVNQRDWVHEQAAACIDSLLGE